LMAWVLTLSGSTTLVQACVLGQGLGYDLHGIGKGLDGQLLASTHCGSISSNRSL
jgi:hypothetical protein